MAHSDRDTEIEAIANEFEVATDAMLQVIEAYIAGTITAPDAEDAIELLGEQLKASVTVMAAETVTAAYADGITEALKNDAADSVPAEDHETMASLAVRRLSRRLSHQAEGLVVDGLDRLDQAVEAHLSPLPAHGA